MLLLPGFRTKHKKINFQSPIHNIFIYWIIYGSNRGVFHSTTQVLEVLQVDFWKGSSRKACVELLALQGNSTGGRPPLRLPAGQTDTSQGLLCADSYHQKSFSSTFDSSVESGTLTVQQASVQRSWVAVGSCLCPRAAVDCKLLFHCANVLFSLCGSDLGKSDVPVTGWGSFALKTLQSAHHNVHLLWQLVHPSPTIMSTNYLPFPVPGSHWLFSPFTKG